jgi:hypothetical protein
MSKPLHYSARNNKSIDITRMLIEHGADVDCRSKVLHLTI